MERCAGRLALVAGIGRPARRPARPWCSSRWLAMPARRRRPSRPWPPSFLFRSRVEPGPSRRARPLGGRRRPVLPGFQVQPGRRAGARATRPAGACWPRPRTTAAPPPRWIELAGDVSVDWALEHHADDRRRRPPPGRRPQPRRHVLDRRPSSRTRRPTWPTPCVARLTGRRSLGALGESFPLVLDDPFGGLDPALKPALLELLRRSRRLARRSSSSPTTRSRLLGPARGPHRRARGARAHRPTRPTPCSTRARALADAAARTRSRIRPAPVALLAWRTAQRRHACAARRTSSRRGRASPVNVRLARRTPRPSARSTTAR